MKATDFRWPFLIVLGGVILLGNLAEPASLGITSDWSDGRYRFAGGTAPWALGSSVVILVLYFWLMVTPSASALNPLPGIIRRWLAFWIDFVLAIMMVTPILGVIPCIREWRRTGIFEWSFERTSSAPGDGWVTAVTFLLSLTAILAYWAYPLMRGTPSPGSCVLGYQIAPADERPMTVQRAFLRTLVGFVAVCTPYLAPFIKRNRKRGQFWLDEVFGTYAVQLK
ncbi:RDD family protein [Granulicella aggregans]|uniref:RDD family protein n=1 Tax=Granulicella aggregans TaxID=474949 RepID=UPI0021DFFE0C|nr:RDD family protein [Granulicella aggregans]